MKGLPLFIVLLFGIIMTGCKSSQTEKDKFVHTFESLEKANPVPEWFMDAKFGIYFHWGVYTVPAFANEWYPRTMYMKGSAENFHHEQVYGSPEAWPYNYFITGAKDKQGNFVQFAPKLKSQGGNFDPDEWAQLFADAGARFAGPVAEHHDGFSMWASSVNPWNAKDMGPKLDLVGLLTDAIRKKNMKVILSMHHAYNITGFYEAVPPTSDPKLQMLFGQQGKEKNEAFWLKKHQEIIDQYKPDIIWQDFNLHLISQPVLLDFLAYYYNKAAEWNKEVVATYKDGLNTKCAVLDYERGGPAGITENYWLTDDAISSSSWCYTEGIGYYSKKQVLHGFIDRISKNGNLLLNISPMADGTIPPEQKEILLSMGSWLKKYGEAVYATRAWETYGEGPTLMGGAHGVMGAPKEGTARDIRFTRSKDSKTLYVVMLGWEKDRKEIVVNALSAERINLEDLQSVELINGEAGKYLPLTFKQEKEGLVIQLPEKSFEDLAYVIKLRFKNKIPSPDRYAIINTNAHYYLVPGNNPGVLLGSRMKLTTGRKELTNQWKFELAGKGVYIIRSRENPVKVLAYTNKGDQSVPAMESYTGAENQYWKLDHTYLGLIKISSVKNPSLVLSVAQPSKENDQAELTNTTSDRIAGWNLMEVCELKQQAFKSHRIPGTVEAEEFDTGCQEDAFLDSDEVNEGGAFRPNEPVDIEKCSAGTFNIGWTKKGEWIAYTVNIEKTATYKVTFYTATNLNDASFHLEFDGADRSGIIIVPNSYGYQNWQPVTKPIQLNSGKHVMRLVIDSPGVNVDKIVFQKVN